MIYGGYHTYLYGYEDKRYVDLKDQGDFLKTTGQYYGMEYARSGFGKEFLEVDNARIGGLMNIYYRDYFKPRTLYAVPAHGIAQETILPNANDRSPISTVTLGIFGGIDEKWYELDAGFHGKIKMENEKERLKLAPDSTPASPSYQSTKGRGWVWSNSAMRMNFLARLGLEDKVHFTFAVCREDYDPNYGKVMAKLFIPLNNYFKMQFGTFLYPADAVFIQPVFSYAGISLSPRAGVIINYRDDNIEKVGVFEGAFMSFSASYNW